MVYHEGEKGHYKKKQKQQAVSSTGKRVRFAGVITGTPGVVG
jgi:hypothetical protein